MKANLLRKIERRDFVVGVVGLGYVGLPLLYSFSEKGMRCIGFDIDEKKISLLNQGKSYVKHISEDRVKNGLSGGLVEATTDFSRIVKCDGILITVPTPLNPNREPDMSFITSSCRTIAKHLRKGQIIILESTTYPETTEKIMVPILEESGLKDGADFFVAYSPEREDPNNPDYSTWTIPKVVGATTPEGLEIAQKLYAQVVQQVVPVSSPRVAEATKLLENIFRAVNIALVNELKITLDRMGINIWEVIEAASTKPFGFMPFYPGPGLGGHCIPIDPFYLTWKAREYGVFTRFIELAGEINTLMPDYVVTKVVEALNNHGKPIRGAKILVLGLAYKPNVDDDRESPTYRLMERLERLGAEVSYNDPYIPVIGSTREFPKYAGRTSNPITDSYDLLLIATAHDEYREMDFTQFQMPIVDTRNILKGQAPNFYNA